MWMANKMSDLVGRKMFKIVMILRISHSVADLQKMIIQVMCTNIEHVMYRLMYECENEPRMITGD